MARKITVKELAKKIASLDQKSKKDVTQGIFAILSQVSRTASNEAPFRTGLLRSNKTIGGQGTFTQTLQFKQEYASYVHDGTRFQKENPFLDRAVDNERAFIDKKAGQLIDVILNQF